MSTLLLACIDQKLNSIINRDFQLSSRTQNGSGLINEYPKYIDVSYVIYSKAHRSGFNDNSRMHARIYFKQDYTACVNVTSDIGGNQSRSSCTSVQSDIQKFITAFQIRDPTTGNEVTYDSATKTYTFAECSISFE